MSLPAQRLLVIADASCDTVALQDAIHGFAVDPGARVQMVGPSPDPIAAAADALARFPATELIVASRSNELVDHALARFGLPTIHVTASVSAVAA